MEPLKLNTKRLISVKNAKKLIIYLIGILIFDLLFFAIPIIADQGAKEAMASGTIIEAVFEENIEESVIINHLPGTNDLKVTFRTEKIITAYNSEIGQTDDSPCITANGFNVCEHGQEDTIAANFLQFGTKVRIPELFGERVFIVRDRMNKRFSNRVDVWMIRDIDARTLGVQVAMIEVLE